MRESIIGAIVGAIITGLFSLLIFQLGNFSTQESIVNLLSERFNSVDKEMSYEQALETIYQENENLKSENEKYINELLDAREEISKMQSKVNIELEEIKLQYSNELENLKQQHNSELTNKYDVDFQNIDLIINGIDAKYNNKVAIINGETFYSMGFLQYLVDSENISENNNKLFIGDIQSDEKMPISLFDITPTFSKGYLIRTTDEEDNFENTYDKAFKVVTSTLYYDDLNGATEFLVDKKYSKFTFDAVHSKYANQDYDYEIIIYGDDKQLKTITISKKTRIQSIEIDISDVEFLQIIGKGKYGGSKGDTYYGLIVEPYLYP